MKGRANDESPINAVERRDMEQAELTTGIELPTSFVDVLYLSSANEMHPDMKKLLKQRKLSFFVLGIDKFALIADRLDHIGTVIIDTEGVDHRGQQKLARVMETLEMQNVGAILLSEKVDMPVKSFSLSPSRSSFSMAGTIESISAEDIWVRISVNLAYRKKGAGIVVKPAIPPAHARVLCNQKLGEQLKMTQVLAGSLAEQLEMAGLVQRDFLPTQLPNTDKVRWAATFLPAEWVSGDIYDVVRLSENHIGFYVADAVGHAMPAALLTIFLKQALVMRETTENSYRIFSPAETMRNLNVRMTGQKLSGYQFATCCYCLLNTKTMELTFARAGHPYPVLLRAGQEPRQIEVRGSLLGIFQQAEYLEETVQLQKGDKVVVYSDGAEPFVGSFNEQTGFVFKPDFLRIKDLPITEWMEEFNCLVKNGSLDPAEVDDITGLGLEIL